MPAHNHPNRKPNRLAAFDYNTVGAYFITICVRDRACVFGEIANDAMQLNPVGEIARDCWQAIPQHFSFAQIDAFVIMPNHVHGIIWIRNADGLEEKIDAERSDGAARAVGNADLRSLQRHQIPAEPAGLERTKMAVSKIIHGFKSSVSRRITREYPDQSFAWQKSFHDHVIRSESELQRIRDYIAGNPAAWLDDELFPNIKNP